MSAAPSIYLLAACIWQLVLLSLCLRNLPGLLLLLLLQWCLAV
jgi:hypothetical protein